MHLRSCLKTDVVFLILSLLITFYKVHALLISEMPKTSKLASV